MRMIPIEANDTVWLRGGEALATWFWKRAGEHTGFPRNMVQATPIALPLAIIFVDNLNAHRAQQWLQQRGAGSALAAGEVRLKGLLVAAKGRGIVFVDPSSDEDEVRFTIAHEVAHFLLHHCRPRAHAIHALGQCIVPVLDGERPPSFQERLSSALSGVRIGEYYHADALTSSGHPQGEHATQEVEADMLAFSLLAPLTRLKVLGAQDVLRAELVERFGLPDWAADAYAAWINARNGHSDSVRDWFLR